MDYEGVYGDVTVKIKDYQDGFLFVPNKKMERMYNILKGKEGVILSENKEDILRMKDNPLLMGTIFIKDLESYHDEEVSDALREMSVMNCIIIGIQKGKDLVKVRFNKNTIRIGVGYAGY